MRKRVLMWRKQATEISLTSGMADGAAVTVRSSGASWSVDAADAGVDAAAVGFVQENFDTSIPGCDDQAVSNDCMILEFTDHGEIKATETDYESESYDSDISEDCPINEEEVSESTSVIKFQSLACLNVNSNGKTSRAATRAAREADMEVDGNLQQKQRDPGQATMEQVGLTLPPNGVMLRMMVTPEEKQKLLANTKIQAIKDVARRRGRKASVKTIDTQTEETPDQDVRSGGWRDGRDVNVNRYIVPSQSDQHRTDVQAPKAVYVVSDEPPEGASTSRMSTHRDVPQPSGTKGSSNGTLLYSQGRGMEAQPLLPGPSWRVDNEHIDVSNQDHIQTFSTNPPKQQHMAAPPNDLLKRPGDQYSGADPPDKKARNNPQEYPSNSTGHSQQLYQRSTRDGKEDTTTRDETRATSANPEKTKMMTTQVDRQGRDPPSPDRTMRETDSADGRTLRQQSDLRLTSTANEDMTSLTLVSPNSSPVDTDKMAQFTEYTENMRRNMRQDYRNLSLLLKSFTDGLQEKNNNQSSQSRADVRQPEKARETNDKTGCLIM